MLILEIAGGIVLGVVLVRTLPAILGAAYRAVIALAAVAGVVVTFYMIYRHWQQLLVFVGVLTAILIGAALVRAVETRSRYTMDEAFIMTLSMGAIVFFAALLGFVGLPLVIGFGSWESAMVAGFCVIVIALSLGLVYVFMRRGAHRPGGWNATAPTDAKLVGSGEE